MACELLSLQMEFFFFLLTIQRTVSFIAEQNFVVKIGIVWPFRFGPIHTTLFMGMRLKSLHDLD